MLDAATLAAPSHPDDGDAPDAPDVLDVLQGRGDPDQEVRLSAQAAAAYAEAPVTYTAVLPVPRHLVVMVAELLDAHWRHELRTRNGRRAWCAWDQAIAFLRWMIDDVEPDRLARDTGIGRSTAYRNVADTLDLVAQHAPGLHGALLAAQAAGHRHVNLDGSLMHTDRVSIPGPTSKKTSKKISGDATTETETSTEAGAQGSAEDAGQEAGKPAKVDKVGKVDKVDKVDLFWSGKHKCHGVNIQVLTAPDGWPLWVSDARPGREHDVTAARLAPDLLATLEGFTDADHKVLADLGYQGEPDVFVLPVKAGANGKDDHGDPLPLTTDQQCLNALHSATRARAEQGNAWLKMTFKVLRKVRMDPWRVGKLVAAALVLLHVWYDRTT